MPAWQICLRNTNVRCPPPSRLVHRGSPPSVCRELYHPRQTDKQFERLPTAGTDRCPLSVWPNPERSCQKHFGLKISANLAHSWRGYIKFRNIRSLYWSQDSSVSIATRYGLDGPWIESWWGRDFPRLSRPALRPTQPPIQWVPGLSRGLKRPKRGVDHPPHLALRLRKE